MSQYTRLRQPATQPRQIIDEERCQQVTAVKTAKELLATPVRSALLAQIQVKANAPAGIFEKFYKDLIEIVAEFYQDLPGFTPPFNSYGGLLDNALHRASAVLDERRQLRLPEGDATDEQVSEEYALWTYMLFTVGLMRDIGKLHNCYYVYLCDSEGLVPRRWQPYDGAMNQQSGYYRFKQIDLDRVKLDPSQWDKRAGPNLAYKLMSSESFNWIHGNAAAYRIWWYELGDEEEEGRGGKGTKNAIDNAETASIKIAMQLSDIAVMEKFVKDAEASVEAQENVKNLPSLEMDPTKITISDSVEVTFVEYIKAQAESGNPQVQTHADGTVTVQASVVESFSQNFPQAGDANSVYSQLSNSTANTANVTSTSTNTSTNTSSNTNTTATTTTNTNANQNSIANPAVAKEQNINASIQASAAAAMVMAASQFPAGVEATPRSSVTLRAGR